MNVAGVTCDLPCYGSSKKSSFMVAGTYQKYGHGDLCLRIMKSEISWSHVSFAKVSEEAPMIRFMVFVTCRKLYCEFPDVNLWTYGRVGYLINSCRHTGASETFCTSLVFPPFVVLLLTPCWSQVMHFNSCQLQGCELSRAPGSSEYTSHLLLECTQLHSWSKWYILDSEKK